MTAYATESDAKEFGITAAQADNLALTDYLELASRVVDGYTGRTFDTASRPVTVSDVRNPMVPLPTPFSNITSVTVNGRTLDASTYIVDTWGIRLYVPGTLDVDGFPRTLSGLRTPRYPYGAQVTVTATFGPASVPTPVKQATLLITAFLLDRSRYRPTASVDTEGNPSVLPSAGYTPSHTPESTSSAAGPDFDTTGVLDADRLLNPYRAVMVG